MAYNLWNGNQPGKDRNLHSPQKKTGQKRN